MSNSENRYLTDEATVELIYSHLLAGNLESASTYLKGLGDDKVVMKTWIGVQCDINNVKGDPVRSEMIGRAGVEYALSKDYKTGAAMMLHNISAFYMPEFDENVLQEALPRIVEASARQIDLREQLTDRASLGWAYWDHAMALLASGKIDEAHSAFNKAIGIAGELEDKSLAAWSNLFIGKSIYKTGIEREKGVEIMKSAVKIIESTGESWEKDESAKILRALGVSV